MNKEIARKTFIELDDEFLSRLRKSSFLAREISGGGSRIFFHGKANLVGGVRVLMEVVFGLFHGRRRVRRVVGGRSGGASRAFGRKRHENGENCVKKLVSRRRRRRRRHFSNKRESLFNPFSLPKQHSPSLSLSLRPTPNSRLRPDPRILDNFSFYILNIIFYLYY